MLRPDQKGAQPVCTPGGIQHATVVSESGLYRLVMRSNVPKAEEFQDWLTDEVIPSIMATGTYSVQSAAPAVSTVPTTSEGHLALAEAYLEAARALKASEARTEALVVRLEVVEPPALAWSAMADTKGDHAVADAAKMLSRDPSIETGEVRLFRSMVLMGMIFHGKDDRGRKVKRPYQEHVDAGRLALRLTGSWEHPRTGEREAGTPQIRVTTKGLAYLHKRMGGTGTLDAVLGHESTALVTVGA